MQELSLSRCHLQRSQALVITGRLQAVAALRRLNLSGQGADCDGSGTLTHADLQESLAHLDTLVL